MNTKNKTFIIAEAGVNHNGRLDIALKLVDAAADAGASAIKFQTFKADRVVTGTAPKAKYQVENMGTSESQAEMLKRLELSYEMHTKIFAYCRKKGIQFISTPFDMQGADFLEELGVSLFKISSGEITNKPLVQHIALKKKPIILSTGASFLSEVEKAVYWIVEVWGRLSVKPELTLLHCVSNYPANVEDVNLLCMKTIEKALGFPVGYSDHTMGIEIPVAAVALGAAVIEKHFTLDRNMEGPDHKASLEPQELKSMVNAIRHVEQALGDEIKKPAKGESETRTLIRRSLVCVRDIKAGEKISMHDLTEKRPGHGISPEFKEEVAGLKSARDISADSTLLWEDFQHA